MNKRAVSAICILSLSVNCFASGWLEDFYNKAGAVSNSTGSSAYKGQSMNVYNGGSFYMRIPNEKANLVRIDPPSLEIGCNGIDAHLGSFSFINKDKFVQMLKSLGTSTGFAYILAMSGLAPIIEKTMSKLQDITQKLNALNINSCQMAKGIAADFSSGAGFEGALKTAGTMSGVGPLYDDVANAYDQWGKDKGKRDASLDNAMANPSAAGLIPQGNLTWKALKKLQSLDDMQRMALLRLFGTVVFDAKRRTIDYASSNVSQLDKFIGDSAEKVEVPIYKCEDGTDIDQCLVINRDDKHPVDSFKSLVKTRLAKIKDNIVQDKPNTSADAEFVNATSFPVYKAIAVYSASNKGEFATQWLNTYEDLIAIEYTRAYVEYVIQAITPQLNDIKTKNPNSPVATAIDNIFASFNPVRDELNKKLMEQYGKATQANTIGQAIMFQERALVGSISARLTQSLAWSSGIR